MAGNKGDRDKSDKYRVFIVDDHHLVRIGVGQMIGKEKDFELCGEAEDAHSALQKINELQPDLAIVDITLKDMNGLELVKQLRGRFPDLAILVLSMHDENIYAERVIQAGAQGYIMKQEMAYDVVEAIRRIRAGSIFMSDEMTSQVLSKMASGKKSMAESPIDHLSDRELEVFQLLGEGLSTRKIAEKLFLSIHTIETYRKNLKRKLDIKTSNELIKYAVEWSRDNLS